MKHKLLIRSIFLCVVLILVGGERVMAGCYGKDYTSAYCSTPEPDDTDDDSSSDDSSSDTDDYDPPPPLPPADNPEARSHIDNAISAYTIANDKQTSATTKKDDTTSEKETLARRSKTVVAKESKKENTGNDTPEGDPVLVADGTWTHSETDLSYRYYGLDISSKRQYGESVTGEY